MILSTIAVYCIYFINKRMTKTRFENIQIYYSLKFSYTVPVRIVKTTEIIPCPNSPFLCIYLSANKYFLMIHLPFSASVKVENCFPFDSRIFTLTWLYEC